MTRFSLPTLSAAVLAAACGTSAFAQVMVKDPWVRATVPQQMATGAFMQLSAPAESRLVEVRSSVAGVVEIHEMAMEGNVMKMRAVPGVELPAGKTVELKPGGYHVMLMDLKQPLKKGEAVPIRLRFEAKDRTFKTIEIKAQVRELGANTQQHELQH